MSDNRPARYLEDDGATVVYRASSLGLCPKAIVALADGYTPAPMPEWFREVLDEGTRAEPVISAMWDKETGIPTTSQQMVVELEIGVIAGRRVIVRAHIDGQAGVDPVLREYKKFRDSTWPDFLRQGVEVTPTYPWQVSAMMHATGWGECEFVGGHYDTDEEKITEVHPKLLAAPPIPLSAIKARIARIEADINGGVHVDKVTCTGMFPCPVFYLHSDEELPRVEDPKLIAIAEEIRAVLDEASRCDKEAKDLRKMAKGLYADLRSQLDQEEGAVLMGKYRVTWGKKDIKGYTVEPKSDEPYMFVKETR